MGKDTKKTGSSSGSKKPAASQSGASATPQPKRSDTNVSSKSTKCIRDEEGRISPKKIACAVFGGISVTPTTRNGSKKSAKPEERSQKPASGKQSQIMPKLPEEASWDKTPATVKRSELKADPPQAPADPPQGVATSATAKRSESRSNSREKSYKYVSFEESEPPKSSFEDVGIPVLINSDDLPSNWIRFTIPFDEKKGTESIRWAGGESYTLKEIEQWRAPIMGYLGSIVPAKLKHAKTDLTAIFRFTAPMESDHCPAYYALRNTLVGELWWMRRAVNITINLHFDTEREPKLEDKDLQATMANMVQACLLKVQDEWEVAERIKQEKRRAKKAREEKPQEDPQYLMSGALPNPETTARESVGEGRGRSTRRKSGIRTMLENSDDEIFGKWGSLERPPTPPGQMR